MAHAVIQNSKLWLDAYDLSGDMSALALNYAADVKPSTTLGMAAKSRTGGLLDVSASHEGLWNGGALGVDDVLFAKIGVVDVPMSIAPITGAEGELAYTFLSHLGQYTPGGPVGEMFGFSVSAEGTGPLVRGTVLQNATRIATANGTAYQLGQVPAGKKLYAALHVLAVSGGTPSLTVKIQSDTVGFPSAADQITFSAATTIGSQWGSVAGAITDDYWRVSYTISGSTPSFTFVVVTGIQ